VFALRREIRGGDSFTKEDKPRSGLPLVRRCREHEPFKIGGSLLDALPVPEIGDETSFNALGGGTGEKVISRLGYELAASRGDLTKYLHEEHAWKKIIFCILLLLSSARKIRLFSEFEAGLASASRVKNLLGFF
jgi:hypothetical protein